MSRYIQPYKPDGSKRYQTIATSGSSARSTAIDARRITIMTGAVPHYIEFGTSTVVATTTSAVTPANSMIDYHFESGQYVAVLSSNGSSMVTIIDAD